MCWWTECFNEAAINRSRKGLARIRRRFASRRASMRPRSTDRGKELPDAPSASRAGRASMRPRSTDRGKVHRTRVSKWKPGFNEAAINRSRKAGLLLLGLYPSEASMRPRSTDRGKQLDLGDGSPCLCGFNEAAINRSRKVGGVQLWLRNGIGRASMRPRSTDRGKLPIPFPIERINCASMRPRSTDRGKPGRFGFQGPEGTSFNEAAINRSRKAVVSGPECYAFVRFNEAAINRSRKVGRRKVGPGRRPAASMRPRSTDRGKLQDVSLVGESLDQVASMRPRSTDRGKVGNLIADKPNNMRGASMRPRSTDRGKRPVGFREGRTTEASMRPRSTDRGKVWRVYRQAADAPGFNEAAINRSRKVGFLDPFDQQVLASMRPRSTDRGKSVLRGPYCE